MISVFNKISKNSLPDDIIKICEENYDLIYSNNAALNNTKVNFDKEISVIENFEEMNLFSNRVVSLISTSFEGINELKISKILSKIKKVKI